MKPHKEIVISREYAPGYNLNIDEEDTAIVTRLGRDGRNSPPPPPLAALLRRSARGGAWEEFIKILELKFFLNMFIRYAIYKICPKEGANLATFQAEEIRYFIISIPALNKPTNKPKQRHQAQPKTKRKNKNQLL